MTGFRQDAQGALFYGLSLEDLRAEEIAVSPHDGRRAVPPAAFAWLHERMGTAGVAPAKFRISIPLTNENWLNVTARFQRPDVQAPPALLGATLVSLALVMAALWLGLPAAP